MLKGPLTALNTSRLPNKARMHSTVWCNNAHFLTGRSRTWGQHWTPWMAPVWAKWSCLHRRLSARSAEQLSHCDCDTLSASLSRIHDAVVVASDPRSSSQALVLDPERMTKLLHITSSLDAIIRLTLQSLRQIQVR